MDSVNNSAPPSSGKSWADIIARKSSPDESTTSEPLSSASAQLPEENNPSWPPYHHFDGMSWADITEMEERKHPPKNTDKPAISTAPPKKPHSPEEKQALVQQNLERFFQERTHSIDWLQNHLSRDEFKASLIHAEAFFVPSYNQRSYEIWISFSNGYYPDGKMKWAFARAKEISGGPNKECYSVHYINPKGKNVNINLRFDKTIHLTGEIWQQFWFNQRYKPFWTKERPNIKYCPGEHVRGFLLSHFNFPKNDQTQSQTGSARFQTRESCLPPSGNRR